MGGYRIAALHHDLRLPSNLSLQDGTIGTVSLRAFEGDLRHDGCKFAPLNTSHPRKTGPQDRS